MCVYRDELEIPYTSRDFPRGTVPHAGCLRTNWNELLWAAITVGRPNTAYVFHDGEASYHEALFRLSLVRMGHLGDDLILAGHPRLEARDLRLQLILTARRATGRKHRMGSSQ